LVAADDVPRVLEALDPAWRPLFATAFFLGAKASPRTPEGWLEGHLRPRVGAKVIGSDYGRRCRIHLDVDDVLDMPEVSVRLAETVHPDQQTRLERLFRSNCSGIVRRGGRAQYSALEKDHWDMAAAASSSNTLPGSPDLTSNLLVLFDKA